MKTDSKPAVVTERSTTAIARHHQGRNNQMNCAEFQRDLPLIIDSGGTEEQEEHLRTCEVCRDLVNDLRYIAEQAKLLVPMQDPSPKVWEGIEQKLKVEGLVKPLQARRSL
jgi:predicted anti-sigma-YlaC factor YlaD